MKIGHLDLPSARITATGDRPVARSSSSSPASAGSSTQVALSSAAASLLGGEDASFDAAKVERIAQAIRDGSFRINAGAIADKLLDNAQELLARPPRH
ncbi:flagellar biosynthesis anti-sigma factor FlgM [uncultured Azohydromonas sp.]|jgi:flagellar biosynthesis anti-sigma factor FlgM|uniref:flagellar biosynthesis anti-sigma factor FlgM n=1 Tax=uncultured Azohydromonas sp. TaxID=487342 RepID=UPI002635C8DB|nr:flagellar biosynthesis anti-sigma factor FlgM [uncultured Azohydromonas sp.]